MSKTATKVRRPSHEYPGFAAWLDAQVDMKDKRKGERTRDRLKAAAAWQLEEVGYRELRVTDINERAGVSNALFYVYFKNKQELTQEVLTEFLATLQPAMNENPAGPDDAIYRGNLGYARAFAANPGLMRCLLQFGDEIPEFGSLWNAFNTNWIERTVASVERRADYCFATRDELVAAIASLGMMVDGLLRLVFVERNVTVAASVKQIGQSPEELAAFLTQLWHRVIYVRDADPLPSNTAPER